MFIRRTRIRSIGERYFTFRLVRSERTGSTVHQHTLLNLGRRFDMVFGRLSEHVSPSGWSDHLAKGE